MKENVQTILGIILLALPVILIGILVFTTKL